MNAIYSDLAHEVVFKTFGSLLPSYFYEQFSVQILHNVSSIKIDYLPLE